MTDDLLVEMLVAGTWTEITNDVRTESPITVTRGKGELASQASPSVGTLTLNNGASNMPATLGQVGCYSPRNPVGPYFGKIGRNTQIRVARKTDAAFDAYSNSSGTGDLSWTHTPTGDPTGVVVFAWQYGAGPGVLSVTYGGVEMERKTFVLLNLQGVDTVAYMYWLGRNIPPGPQSVVIDTGSAVGRQASALTFVGGTNCELDNYTFAQTSPAGGTSANPGVPLVAFKRAVLVGSLFSDLNDGSTIGVTAGFTQLGEHDIGNETVNVMRAGVQSPHSYGINWTAAAAGWGIMAAAVRAVSYRIVGEISELPPRWDLSHREAWVPITVSGILRRLQRGNEPAKIGLREYVLSQPQSLTSYWPLSGAEGTTFSVNLGKTWEGSTRFFPEGSPVFKYGIDLNASWLGTGLEINATGNIWNMRGDVGTGEDSGVALDFLWQSNAMGTLTAALYDYRGNSWSVTLNDLADSGEAQVSFNDPAVGPIGFAPTAVLAALQDNAIHHCRLQLIVDGADTDYTLYIDGQSVKTGTMAGYTWLGTGVVRFYYSRGIDQTYVNLAHVIVWSENDPANIPSAADVSAAAHGYTGETAGERMERVADLAGIGLTIVGDVGDTSGMGVQFAEPTLAQIRDAEATDLGVLTEARDALELLYRTRASQYNQTPKLTLDYSAHQVAAPFEPVDDDAATVNDVTATRRDGDSYRLTKDSGALSTLDPPNGVGPYADEITVNAETDAQLKTYAAWFLNLGTLDQLRFPTLTVNLLAPDAAALKDAVLATDIGDLIRVTDLVAIGIYDDLDLIVTGYTETIGPIEHVWTANLIPAALYSPAVWGTSETVGESRWDTYSSALTAGVTSTATSLSVSSLVTLWTQDPDAFPFDIMIGGERMTVTAIAGATSPQTFTVTRSVNGVVKAHLSGADVRLYPTPRYAL